MMLQLQRVMVFIVLLAWTACSATQGSSTALKLEHQKSAKPHAERGRSPSNHQFANGHWSYQGVEGPDHWAMLKPSYMTCETGRQQSPINIVMPHAGYNQENLEFHYKPTPLIIRNNGHTIQVNYQKGSFFRLNGRSYKLRQFHFHDPSEHHIDGKAYPMEMHLVHQDEKGHIVVIGVLLTFGKENPAFARVGDWLQAHIGHRFPAQGQEVSTDLTFDLMDVLPDTIHHFSYHGSLTTPPCSEGVQWVILKVPMKISKKQADRFITTIGQNARPIQPLNYRDVQEN
ncbi:MAG: hypothetical protein GKS05_01285 [Nitrospirales bacterium]|nr:hypothetical protein [Nitrospirales bacterium]